MANITRESLKNVCDQVLPLLVPPESISDHKYTYEAPDVFDYREERTAKSALLPLKNQIPEMAGHVPVMKCFYNETKFYLTPANKGMVFELHCEDVDQDIYSLKSGVYPVKYNP